MRQRPNNRRGIALAMVIISALVFSVFALAILTLSMNKQAMSGDDVDRMRARYAAEAALVIAYQKLWNEHALNQPYPPAASCPGGPGNPCTATEMVDTDGGGPLPETAVEVEVFNWGVGNDHKVTATVSYE